MISERLVLHGTVRNGVIILEKGFMFPDGVSVEITLADDTSDLSDSFHVEMLAWDQAGADSWALIDDLEQAEAPSEAEH